MESIIFSMRAPSPGIFSVNRSRCQAYINKINSTNIPIVFSIFLTTVGRRQSSVSPLFLQALTRKKEKHSLRSLKVSTRQSTACSSCGVISSGRLPPASGAAPARMRSQSSMPRDISDFVMPSSDVSGSFMSSSLTSDTEKSLSDWPGPPDRERRLALSSSRLRSETDA